MSNCVIISNLKPSTSTESVQFYFENIRRSNGGEIEKVQRLDDGVSCLVFFQDYTGWFLVPPPTPPPPPPSKLSKGIIENEFIHPSILFFAL